MTGAADRFADAEERIEALLGQKIIRGKRQVAEALAQAGAIVTFAPGAELIRQGDSDSDCYFLLTGSIDLRVNGDTLPYGRAAGEVVGEFVAINPQLRRTATVIARQDVVALKCSSKALHLALKGEADVWRLLAVDLTHKVEQRNQLISATNERPAIFMIAAENRIEIAKELELALKRDFDVTLWSDEDLKPPGGYELETLHNMARSADFGIVLAHPDDLLDSRDRMSDDQWATVRFELGYLMSELTRHRTLLLIPHGGSETPARLFKGVQPMTYDLPPEGMPLRIALARAVDEIRELVAQRKVRSRLQQAP